MEVLSRILITPSDVGQLLPEIFPDYDMLFNDMKLSKKKCRKTLYLKM